MCKMFTRDQWIASRGATYSRDVVNLATAAWENKLEEAIGVLHDALLDDGHEELASHFLSPEKHEGKGGPGLWREQCWALLLILNKQSSRPLLLGTPTAAAWCGITPEQFRRLVEAQGIKQRGSYVNKHYQSRPPSPFSAPPPLI